MKRIERRSDCPISLSLDIYGDKWTLLILRDFIFFDNRHFNKLVTNENISTNILADRLNRLRINDIIKKEVDVNNKSSYLYSLTEKGIELIPIVIEIYKWGANNIEGNNANSEFKNEVNSNFSKVTAEIIDQLKTTHNKELR